MNHADRFILNIDTGLETERRAVFHTRDEVDDYVFERLASNDAVQIEVTEFDPDLGMWVHDSTIKPGYPNTIWVQRGRTFIYCPKEEA